ncbi:Cystinosin-like protein [Zalerion maritima]|uniref:Cystinosin-like protein n=1 Tax=Zalerion maritima TaxID=339359 RepID=A0AAD5RZW0_9PEZI|nr:Cystinosin-like protein [Zalerion maritima]
MGFTFLEFLSTVFGWVYTIAWSLSFYPQPLLNWKRKSTSGTTMDFPLINCLGFLTYFIFNALFLYSPTVREQYAARHHGLTPTAQFNDLVFAFHAFVLSAVSTSMYFPSLWSGFSHGSTIGRRPSRTMSGIMVGCLVGVAIVVFIVLGSPSKGYGTGDEWCWLDAVYSLSYVKLIITLVKYTPQIVTNYRHRSTAGWSIWQILLDLMGGFLSIAQQGVDSYIQRDWSGITGNPVKFALGNVSIAYDVLFLLQHYVLYPDEGDKHLDAIVGERTRLLEEGGGREARSD